MCTQRGCPPPREAPEQLRPLAAAAHHNAQPRAREVEEEHVTNDARTMATEVASTRGAARRRRSGSWLGDQQILHSLRGILLLVPAAVKEEEKEGEKMHDKATWVSILPPFLTSSTIPSTLCFRVVTSYVAECSDGYVTCLQDVAQCTGKPGKEVVFRPVSPRLVGRRIDSNTPFLHIFGWMFAFVLKNSDNLPWWKGCMFFVVGDGVPRDTLYDMSSTR